MRLAAVHPSGQPPEQDATHPSGGILPGVHNKKTPPEQSSSELALPAGYKVSTESLNKLTSSVSNECGEFTVTAKAEGDKVQIQVRKSFLHRLEPAANWDKVLKLVDASSAFTDKEIVIMK